MKRELKILLLFVCFIQIAFAQDSMLVNTTSVIVANKKLNDLYLTIDNPLQVSVNGMKKCRISTDNGKLREENGSYFISPAKVGKCTITVSSIDGKSKNEILFRVRNLPQPELSISNMRAGEDIDKVYLCNGPLLLYYMDFDLDIFFSITYFDMLITTTEGKIFSFSGTSQKFTPEMKEQLCKLKSKDVVMIYHVRAYAGQSMKNEYFPKPAVFVVK